MYSDELISPWFDCLAEELGGLALFDAHTHTGANDPDGLAATDAELLAALELAAGARAVVFTLHEPGGYGAANDRVLAEAERSGGRLVPFCRVDPRRDGTAEAERCLDAGARGIKLHPRAERFQLADPEARPLFALANERGVAVLVHAGRGIPALGRDALELCAAHPRMRLILAHAGICDLSWIWRHTPDHPNLLFDTSWWSPDDLLALLALVPPGQVLLGSDAPYGTPLLAAVGTLRCALQVGLSHEQVRSIAGAQLERLVAGEEPRDLGPAPGSDAARGDVLLGRVHTFLVAAVARMLRGQDASESLALARLACDVPDGMPQQPACRSVVALLDRVSPEGAPDEARTPYAPGLHVVLTALAVARTPDVAMPVTV